MELTKIKLSNRKTIELAHNLSDHGVNIEDALECWLARTNKQTVESFCEYIKSKGHFAIPKSQLSNIKTK